MVQKTLSEKIREIIEEGAKHPLVYRIEISERFQNAVLRALFEERWMDLCDIGRGTYSVMYNGIIIRFIEDDLNSPTGVISFLSSCHGHDYNCAYTITDLGELPELHHLNMMPKSKATNNEIEFHEDSFNNILNGAE